MKVVRLINKNEDEGKCYEKFHEEEILMCPSLHKLIN